jgi:dodecin
MTGPQKHLFGSPSAGQGPPLDAGVSVRDRSVRPREARRRPHRGPMPTTNDEEDLMPEKVYKKIEIVGTSTSGYEDAIQNAIQQARKTLKGLSWFEVCEMRGNLQAAQIIYQATLKVGFEVVE